MNKVLFLCLVVLCATSAFAAEEEYVERAPVKRALLSCRCEGKTEYGDKWLFHGGCPNNYGYNYKCFMKPGAVCCYPQNGR
uniref:Delta-actitoxin-Amc2a n=1 Tax=Antheopsis maculata TaxID=280228 RepID=BDS2A_ANTMC|nr:RecName: Full=Delta-actitoxin-Amc2a; Short=Delta-AITX-Amc2a; AltName: Full=Peptide toxin Am II; AltName: Full=Peptide toxin Am-2; Flags: Precursor [Antheopsis maculata]BAD74022.1 peptide toxin [Antheopsis maculata]